MKACPRKNLYPSVYSSTFHDRQKVETTQMFISGWLSKMWCRPVKGMLSIKRCNRTAAVKFLGIQGFYGCSGLPFSVSFSPSYYPDSHCPECLLGDSSKPGVVSRSCTSSLPKDGKFRAQPKDHWVEGNSLCQPMALIFAFSFPKENGS